MVGHPRQWEFTDYGNKHHMKAKEGSELSVMSYNILAQDLLEDHPYLYEDRGDNALSWDYRRHRLVQEIKFHQADVTYRLAHWERLPNIPVSLIFMILKPNPDPDHSLLT